MSKKEQFIAAMNALPADTSRKVALEILSVSCGLTIAGASTYYANVKSGKWNTNTTMTPVVKPETEVAPGVTVDAAKSESIAVVAGVTIKEIDGRTFVDDAELDTMTGPELVTLFNKHVDPSRFVTKFRTKADGIKRIVDMLCE